MRTFFAFALLATLTGCETPADERAAPATCADAAVHTDTAAPTDDVANDAAAAPPREALSWVVEFPTAPKLAEVPSIVFRGAEGLAPVLGEVTTGDAVSLLRSNTPFDAFGGDTKDATELAAWWAKILAHTPCDGCDPNREWIAAQLTRDAVVTARTRDGEWLARWTLADAWPADLLSGKRADGGVEIASLRLAGTPRSFEMNPMNPWLASQLKAASLAPTKLPDTTIAMGTAPAFATSVLARRFLGVDGLVAGLSTFALVSNPLYAAHGNSGENPLFEPTSGGVLRSNLEVRDGEVVLLRAIGIKMEIEVIEFRNGDDAVVRKRPGRCKYKNLTLSRVTVADSGLFTWYDETLAGTAVRRSLSVIALDAGGKEVARYTAINAAPAPITVAPTQLVGRRWKAPELNSQSSRDGHVVEALSLVAERLEMVTK